MAHTGKEFDLDGYYKDPKKEKRREFLRRYRLWRLGMIDDLYEFNYPYQKSREADYVELKLIFDKYYSEIAKVYGDQDRYEQIQKAYRDTSDKETFINLLQEELEILNKRKAKNEEEIKARKDAENEKEQKITTETNTADSTENETLIVNPATETKIENLSGGEPLDKETKEHFEESFGEDFSDVRIHTDKDAAETAEEVDAKAFTKGEDIVFNEGEYEPGTSDGKELLAHELGHVGEKQGGELVYRAIKDKSHDQLLTKDEINEAIGYNKQNLHYDLISEIYFYFFGHYFSESFEKDREFVLKVAEFQRDYVAAKGFVFKLYSCADTIKKHPGIDGKVGINTLNALEKAGVKVYERNKEYLVKELKKNVIENLNRNEKYLKQAQNKYGKEGQLNNKAFSRIKQIIKKDEELSAQQLDLRIKFYNHYWQHIYKKEDIICLTPYDFEYSINLINAYEMIVESRIYLRMLYPELNILYPDPEHKVLLLSTEQIRYYPNLYDISTKTNREIKGKMDDGFLDIYKAIAQVREDVNDNDFPLEMLNPVIERLIYENRYNKRLVQDIQKWQHKEFEKVNTYNFVGKILTIGLDVLSILAAPFSGGASLLLFLGGSLAGLATSVYNFERAGDVYNAAKVSEFSDEKLVESYEEARYNYTTEYIGLILSMVTAFLAGKGAAKILSMRRIAAKKISKAARVDLIDDVIKIPKRQLLLDEMAEIALRAPGDKYLRKWMSYLRGKIVTAKEMQELVAKTRTGLVVDELPSEDILWKLTQKTQVEWAVWEKSNGIKVIRSGDYGKVNVPIDEGIIKLTHTHVRNPKPSLEDFQTLERLMKEANAPISELRIISINGGKTYTHKELRKKFLQGELPSAN